VEAYRISVKEALRSEYAFQTREAARAEIQNMLQYRVGHYVRWRDIPGNLRKNVLHTFMFIKHKHGCAICTDVLTKPKHGKAFEDARALLVVEPPV